MPKSVKSLRITILVFFAITVVVASLILFVNWNGIVGNTCEQGPLSRITKCSYDQSAESWMNSGWWHSDALGPIDEASCKLVNDGEDQLPFTEMVGRETVITPIYKVSCENFGRGINAACYASQRLAGDGSTRYVKILMVKGCQDARYFEGSKYTIRHGEVEEYDWTTPIPDIPDEKTGKADPTRIYG